MFEEDLPNPSTLRERKATAARAQQNSQARLESDAQGQTKWRIEESSLVDGYNSFNGTFEAVIPKGYSDLKDYIEAILADKKGQAIGIELGGTATRLFGSFDRGLFQRTAGVSLSDNREKISPGLTAYGDSINHSVIVGDMFANPTKQDVVTKFLKGEKADVIIERAILGQSLYPDDADFIAKQADFWYQHLAENGVMFLTPPASIKYDYMDAWEEMIQRNYAGKIEIQADYAEGNYEAIRIRKLPGAPEHLPLIDQRAQFRTVLQDQKIAQRTRSIQTPTKRRKTA